MGPFSTRKLRAHTQTSITGLVPVSHLHNICLSIFKYRCSFLTIPLVSSFVAQLDKHWQKKAHNHQGPQYNHPSDSRAREHKAVSKCRFSCISYHPFPVHHLPRVLEFKTYASSTTHRKSAR